MTHSATALVTYGLCVFRLTRLVTADVITEPMRERLRRRGYRILEHRATPTSPVDQVQEIPKPGRSGARWLHSLVTCPWCFSVYAAAGTVVMARFFGGWFFYVACGLAFSAVAGIVSEKL